MAQLIFFPLVLLALLLQHVRSAPDSAIEERQIVGDLSFCYGDGSICDVSNALYTQCETYQQPYQPVKWYQCVCGNGYVSVDEACYDCQLAYNLSIIYNGPENRRGCSSVGVSIAPIPSSIVAIESVYNKTYTGTLLTQSNVATTGVSDTGTATTTTAVVTSTIRPSPSITPTKPLATGSSHNIGGTSVTTLQGGGQGSLQSSPTTTSAPRATSTGGSGPVVGSSGSAAAISSLFTLFMSFFYLM